MRAQVTAGFILSGVLSTAASPAVAADAARGQQVWNDWCAPCHAPGPKHPGTQALDALYKGAQPGALEQRTDLTPAFVAQFVRQGVSIMPPFRKTEIGDADLAELTAYLTRKR